MVYRADEVDSEKVSKMTREMIYFIVVVTEKDKNKFLELEVKFEEMLKAYNEERENVIHQLEAQVPKMDKKLGKRKVGGSRWPQITYPHTPIEPFKSTPLVELLDILQRLEFYTVEEFEEENNKL